MTRFSATLSSWFWHFWLWRQLGSYLKRLEEGGLEDGGDMTGNKAVDALLYQKRKQADEKNIKWECDVQMPKGYSINEFDLCVLRIAYFIIFASSQAIDMVKYPYQIGDADNVLFHKPCAANDTG